MSDFALPPERANPWLQEIRAMLALSWPMVVTNLAQMAMTATNVAMMGHLDARSLAAGTLGSNLYTAALIFGIGIMAAVTPMISIELGRNRHAVREVRRTVRQGFWVAATMVGPMWLVLWQGETILALLGQDPELSALAAGYVRSLQWSLLPFYCYLSLRGFVAALKRPLAAALVVLVAVGFNALIGWALMFGRLGLPALGLNGSGIATVLSSTLMLIGLAGVTVLDRRFRRFHLFGRIWVPDWPRYRGFWRMGLPIGITLAFEMAIFNGAAFLMGRIGASSVAAHGVAIQIAALCFMVPRGICQAGTVLVARAYGAGDHDGIRRAGTTAIALALSFMCLTALAMLMVPHWLLRPFLDTSRPDSAAVAVLAAEFLLIGAIFQLADGAQTVGSSILRGLHDTRVPMIFAGIGYWGIGLPLSAGLGLWTPLAGRGVWIGLATGLGVVAALMLWRWWQRETLGLMPGKR